MVKEIKKEDYLRFRSIIRHFHPESKHFEFCNGYIAQSTRNYPQRYYLDEDTVAFFTRRTSGANSQYVIVCSAGKKRLEVIRKLAPILCKKSKQDVIIKNVDSELNSLKKIRGFREYKKEESWDDISKSDDNTFPQLVIDVNKNIDLEGSSFKELREEFSLFDRRFNIELIRYKDKHKKIFRELLERWASQMNERTKLDKKELIRATEVFGVLRDDFFQYLVYEKRTRKYVGFISFSTISESCLGYNALVNDFNYEGLYRRLINEGVKVALRFGFEFLNLQGSEERDQFDSKLKLRPSLKLNRKHFVYGR